MGPLALAGIAAGAQIVGGGINAYAQGRMNKKTIRYNERMYLAQRRDALADWNMQNEYNSPSAQMARYKAAGLNPNLIYGQMNEVSPVRSVNADGWRPEAPRYDFVGDAVQTGIGAYLDMQLKGQQLENMKAQESVLAQENALKAAQVQSVLTGTERQRFDLGLVGELRQNSIDMANLALQKTQADLQYTLDENDRRASQNAATLAQAAESILTSRLLRAKTEDERNHIRQQIENLKKDATIKQLDIDLKRLGLQPSDALWQRALGRIIGDPATLPARIKQGVKALGEGHERFMRRKFGIKK